MTEDNINSVAKSTENSVETVMNKDKTNQTNIQDPIGHLRKLLGHDVTLLPIPSGKKKPVRTGWQKTDVSSMEKPEYLQTLRLEGNTGVILGSASGGLCAIDIDDEEQVEPFLVLNPALRTTLRSKGARGEQLWVRVTSSYPKLTKLTTEDGNAWGEWRADGGQSVIRGTHPSGCQYRYVHEGAPVALAFGDIHWPPSLKLPWVKSEFDLLTEEAGTPFSMSENGHVTINQKFFVNIFMMENRVLFDSSLGDFFLYNQATGLWELASSDTIKRKFLVLLGRVAKEAKIPNLHYKCTDFLAGSLASHLRIMVEQRDAFSNRPHSIHVQNGMICFEEGEVMLKGFHPDFFSRNICPCPFDPEAQCPQFLNDFLAPALSQEDITLIQKWAGAILLGKNDAQRMLLLLGTAGGGKSTLMTILESVIGNSNVAQLRTEHLGKPFELFAFSGKTLLTGKDVSSDFLIQRYSSIIKSLIGGDLLEAEKKGQNNRVQMRGNFNIGITCNADLNIRLEGDAAAWRRRLMVVKYDKPATTRKITGFGEKLLKEEGAGILRWMVEGAILLLNDLHDKGDYILSTSQLARVEKLLAQSDSIKTFVRDGVLRSQLCSVTTQQLKQGYYGFCEKNGMLPMRASDISKQLPEYMQEIHQAIVRNDISTGTGTLRGYKGVRLNTEVIRED